ncbi:RluA family pseudouridine synthase [Shewanella baltica]|uniref:RluA family pseudouridine synthase n=1 Tax=Shewanella baltica TaxID=62322 RepID=UPI00217D12BE|nr:RluA family pseudouridine synthase [Shewanella baltica]MCS6127915.1 RluA family pseudouridine synthase [Shewanella baltica]MCS6139988.1 RluA family pseudouridine synthase [Shewanella baltica]MCS6146129.1 RluA family pseudouridine synthase [Shewanella baltica]MCS6170659.1 RluA family pseudouridine synthase [Shewanella baltica]MCS6187796.1 RluA family pseudouridine synthase [Shewanella baltica]
MQLQPSCFISFTQAIDAYALPQRFTFPFYYEPHPLCVLAANELQQHLETQSDWQHNFGLTGELTGAIGKMFGVLLVQTPQGEVGYLSAFSGKLAEQNHWPRFVPPVFDMLAKDNFFHAENLQINQINEQLLTVENHPDIPRLSTELETEQAQAQAELAAHRQVMIDGRQSRKAQRNQLAAQFAANPTDETLRENAITEAKLSQESINEKNQLRDIKRYWDERIHVISQALSQLTDERDALRQQRKRLSAALQQKLFEQYRFLNIKGTEKSLNGIFNGTVELTPPAGSGECAAPKLLHYAFKHDLKPLAIAEFWWGAPPKSEIRQHKQFYPACLRKCQPILGHMLEGLVVDENPLLTNPAEGKTLAILYQDDAMAIVNKPAEFLSVPGKEIEDSVYSRLRQTFPHATGPLIVHRLDMSTSGLMVIALTKDAHKQLQKQFIQRTVTKRYVALLAGIPAVMANKQPTGHISLPLRGDLDDRPRQLVCHEFGKAAETHWELSQLDEMARTARVYLYPKTGRTHQLRVHCAHSEGLNTPIVGDDLYGTRANRLHLHADLLMLQHPVTRERMRFQVDPDF